MVLPKAEKSPRVQLPKSRRDFEERFLKNGIPSYYANLMISATTKA